MSEHLSTEQLHDHLDCVLGGRRRAEVEAHLEGCSSCEAALAAVAEVVTGLRSLPLEASPRRDLWPGTLARITAIEAGVGDPAAGERPSVIAFPAHAGGRRRRVSFTLPQLSAAAVALALLSGTSVWWILRGPADAPGLASGPVAGPVGVASTASFLPAATELDRAVADLRAVLDEGRGLLDDETVRVVEESLATIDEAIAEARRALADDPSSGLLNRLLISHQRAKLRVLQQATSTLVRT